MAKDVFENFDLSSMDDSGIFSKIPASSVDGTGTSSKATGVDPWSEVDMSDVFKPDGTNNQDGRTVAIDSELRKPHRDDDGNYTVIDLPESVKIDPAVGWLVCIEGVDKGRPFRLVKGNNPVGRPGNGKKYAVSLSDQSISRKGACGVIVYDEKTNQFWLTPGDLTANINPYLDDEILLSPKILNPRAKLEIAGDVLIFVPFCSDKFKWNFDAPKPQQASPQERATGFEPPEDWHLVGPGKTVRCPKGHYYNAATSASCPYCAAMEADNDPDGKTKAF